MARRSGSGRRVEPSFESKRGNRDDEDSHAESGTRPSGSRKSKRKARNRRKPRGFFGAIRFLVYWGLVAGLWGLIGVGGIFLYYGAQMPSAKTWAIPDRPPNIKIVALDGSVIANRGATGGEALSLDNMSPYIPEAVISIEDRRFYYHFGFDPIGLARAVVTNLISGHTVQGGSTLTQQLAKNLFLSPERTLARKVQEVLLAVWLEHKFTKDQILAMYLNRMYFGENSYGVEAASRRYFNKSARDLNLMEAATLAGLLKAPSRLSPARNPAGAKARAIVVLGAMKDTGYITDKEMKAAIEQAPTQQKPKSYYAGAGQYVADMVMDRLHDMIGDVKEDLVVETTIDPNLEAKAGEVIRSAIDKNGSRLKVSQGALVSLDGTGAIRALVGGKDYAESQYDRAYKAKRQPGSAFKPFVYVAALEEGRTPESIRNDAPIKIGNWTPENYENRYNGPVTLSYALAHSLNTIAAQLVMEAGPNQVVKVAHRMGIDSDLQANASIALGTSEVTLLELTSAYAPFMNGGYKATPYVIKRISTAAGKVLYQSSYNDPPHVLSPNVVSMMDSMMMRVVNEGTGRAARMPGWEVAGKTGTTQSYRDALFVGFTSNLTTGVWFGNDDGSPMRRVTGGGLPAETWHQFMVAAHKGLTPSPLSGAAAVPVAKVDGPSGNGHSGGKGRSLTDIISDFLNGNSRKEAPPAPIPPVRTTTGNPVPRSPASNGPIPPADVGSNTQSSGNGQKKTLLDIINGN